MSTTHTSHASQSMSACIEHCTACSRTCSEELFTHCLSVGGDHVAPDHVILMVDCAELCRTAADFMTRMSPAHTRLCALCAEVCAACAASCRAIADGSMEHCAEVCESCQRACAEMAHSAA